MNIDLANEIFNILENNNIKINQEIINEIIEWRRKYYYEAYMQGQYDTSMDLLNSLNLIKSIFKIDNTNQKE